MVVSSRLWQLEQAGTPLTDCVNNCAPLAALPGGKLCALFAAPLHAARVSKITMPTKRFMRIPHGANLRWHNLGASLQSARGIGQRGNRTLTDSTSRR